AAIPALPPPPSPITVPRIRFSCKPAAATEPAAEAPAAPSTAAPSAAAATGTAAPPALALPTQWPDGKPQRLWAAATAAEAQALEDGVQEGGRQQVYLNLDDTEVGKIDSLAEQLWGVDKDGAVEPKLLSLEVMDIAIRRMAVGSKQIGASTLVNRVA
ncbi:hypothetical protein HaLaN_30765, partial [Haematococcus lacustris]